MLGMEKRVFRDCLFGLFLFGVFLYACRQEDEHLYAIHNDSRFFRVSDVDYPLWRIVSSLERKNDSVNFSREFIHVYGYPLWNNAVSFWQEEKCVYAVPVESRRSASEIDAIWFFVMNDSCTRYHVYSREMADAMAGQVGDGLRQTWMFDYFTRFALHKQPKSGLMFEESAETRAADKKEACVNTVWLGKDNFIYVDVFCFEIGGGSPGSPSPGGGEIGGGSVEEPGPPYTGGGGGGGTEGGKSGSSSAAPNASLLFKASLTPSEWVKLENHLNKIKVDCMGKTLFDALCKLGKVNFEYMSEIYSAYDLKTNTIKFGRGADGKIDESHLLHEMCHAYQKQVQGTDDFSKATLNGEIEAHFAHYQYMKRKANFAGSKTEKAWRKNVRTKSVINLEKFIDDKGCFIPPADSNADLYDAMDLFDKILNGVVSVFETHDDYQDSTVYKYNWDIKGKDNFKNLRELTKNCWQ